MMSSRGIMSCKPLICATLFYSTKINGSSIIFMDTTQFQRLNFLRTKINGSSIIFIKDPCKSFCSISQILRTKWSIITIFGTNLIIYSYDLTCVVSTMWIVIIHHFPILFFWRRLIHNLKTHYLREIIIIRGL